MRLWNIDYFKVVISITITINYYYYCCYYYYLREETIFT